MSKEKIWVAGIWGEAILQAFSGLAADGSAEIIADDFALKPQVARAYRFISRHLGGRGRGCLQRILEMKVLDRFYRLTNCHYEEYDANDIVLVNSALVHYYSKSYLERLKKPGGV